MNLKKVIKEKGWTLERLASQMSNKHGEKGISHAAVSQLLNGNPTLDKLKEIASILGITVSELVDDGETKTVITCPRCGCKLDIDIKEKE